MAIVYLFAKLASLCFPSVSLTRLDLVWTSFIPRSDYFVKIAVNQSPARRGFGKALRWSAACSAAAVVVAACVAAACVAASGKARFLGREARDFVWRNLCAMRLAQVLVKPRSRGLISCRPMARWGRCSLFRRVNERKKDSRTTGQRTWMRFATVHSLSNIRIPKFSIPY